MLPPPETLAEDLSVEKRHAQEYLKELEAAKLIRRTAWYNDHGQTSNDIVFLCHEVLHGCMRNSAHPGVRETALTGMRDAAHEENHTYKGARASDPKQLHWRQ